ncbi:MAG: aminoacyl-tRNA hydrolase [Oscillospiraceae bacterium]
MFFKQTQGAADYLVVGLGNPGDKYEGSRHNIGFETIDFIAQKAGTKIVKAKFSGLYGVWQYKDRKILLLKPQTFMNLSGQSVGEAARFYKIKPENTLIIYDDVSLDVGKVRIRTKGSAGGHNGIKSIIEQIGDEFPRVKIGVGQKPHPDYDLAAWVLGKFTQDDKKLLQERFEDVYGAVQLLIDTQVEKAMNLYNK